MLFLVIRMFKDEHSKLLFVQYYCPVGTWLRTGEIKRSYNWPFAFRRLSFPLCYPYGYICCRFWHKITWR